MSKVVLVMLGSKPAKPSSEPNQTLQFQFQFGISRNQTAQFSLRFSDFENSGTILNPVQTAETEYKLNGFDYIFFIFSIIFDNFFNYFYIKGSLSFFYFLFFVFTFIIMVLINYFEWYYDVDNNQSIFGFEFEYLFCKFIKFFGISAKFLLSFCAWSLCGHCEQHKHAAGMYLYVIYHYHPIICMFSITSEKY